MSADSEKKKERKLSDPKPSSRDGYMLKYLVRASSTEAATLSSPDSDDDQTQDRAELDE